MEKIAIAVVMTVFNRMEKTKNVSTLSLLKINETSIIKENIDTLFIGFIEAEAVKLFANT